MKTTDVHPKLESWLQYTTNGLCDEAVACVRGQTISMVNEQLDVFENQGLEADLAMPYIMRRLGDPWFARIRMRWKYLTSHERELVAQIEANKSTAIPFSAVATLGSLVFLVAAIILVVVFARSLNPVSLFIFVMGAVALFFVLLYLSVRYEKQLTPAWWNYGLPFRLASTRLPVSPPLQLFPLLFVIPLYFSRLYLSLILMGVWLIVMSWIATRPFRLWRKHVRTMRYCGLDISLQKEARGDESHALQ